MSVTDIISGFDHVRASNDLEKKLLVEITGLTGLVLETARSNVRFYPEVRGHLERHIFTLANQIIVGEVTSDYWQSWLEQFGKGSLMADERQNPGLTKYMNSDLWNQLRSRGRKIVVGRPRGRYKSIDGTIRISKGGYAGVDLEELAERGDIDSRFKPTPPSFFMRKAIQSNRIRILEGLQGVIDNFPYHRYFK